jgi:pantoate--beta-alanine ligase
MINSEDMITVESIPDLRRARADLPSPVGLVPTMGFLHDGHLSLVEKASEECASVVVSIFVNPTQFGPQEDFSAYPRNIPQDLDLLKQYGTNLVWIPATEEMFPPGFQTWVQVEDLSHHLEGKMRPGHFQGVTTIVTKLFTAVQPDRAYFGQKDAQQTVIIKRLILDLNIPVDIVICPIMREDDGLAMSSRNIYLSADERKAAPILNRALKNAENAILHGVNDAEQLRDLMIETIKEEPLATMQYVSCADPDTLEELTGPIHRGLLSMAVNFGKTRLIDNVLIGK